jgi:hypothetical protein
MKCRDCESVIEEGEQAEMGFWPPGVVICVTCAESWQRGLWRLLALNDRLTAQAKGLTRLNSDKLSEDRCSQG